MSTIRGVKDRRFKFVQLLNEMFENPELSLKAKGFIGFCLTKPENWKFHVDQLAAVLKESVDAIYSTLDECLEQGYVYRYRTRNPKGHLSAVEYFVSDSKSEIQEIAKERDKDNFFNKSLPHKENPEVDNPHTEQPLVENPSVDVTLGSPRENDAPIYNNTDLTNTEFSLIQQQQQQQPKTSAIETPDSVVVLPDSPPVGDSPVEKILLSDSKGKQTTVYKQALFSQCVLKGKDWLAEEIEKAWEVLKQAGAVNNWFAFVEGIITNNRKTNKIKQIDNKGYTCQTQNTPSALPSRKPYCSINGVITEIGTPGLHLQNWLQAKKYQK